jgi:hypothetical protein
MTLHPNTEHDEEYIRANWHEGESWLGIESMRAPRHDPPRDVSRGTFLHTFGARSYGKRSFR